MGGNFVILFMATMACQIVTANISLHPALKQYLLSSLGTSSPPLNSRQPLPAVTISKQTSPAPNLQSLAALATLLSSAQSTPPPKPQPPAANTLLAALTDTSSNSPSVDTALLNNLAMAMQLLIVSNLLSSSQESTPDPQAISGYSLYESPEPIQPVSVSYASHPPPQPVPATPVPQPQHKHTQYEPTSNYNQPASSYNHPTSSYNSMSMPNSNYVGSSTFASSSPFMGSVPPPMSGGRNGFSLMSPYEALSPSSPFSDPILSSPYGSVMTSKKDFQSPYSSFMASDSKDLFSMGDFF